jgi:hypothetical protein
MPASSFEKDRLCVCTLQTRVHAATVLLFYSLHKYYLNKSCKFFEDLLLHLTS